MKKKSSRNVLALSLALAIVLAIAPLAALAAPGKSKESAMELKAGQSDTFTGEPNDDPFYWYKFELKAASKVVITASLSAASDNNVATIIVFDYSNDVRGEMRSYVVPKGSVAESSYEQTFTIGVQQDERPLSRTGTYYLDKGWYYIAVGCYLDDGTTGTVKIDSIEPISNTGGVTKASATTIDPSKEVVKQTRFEGNLVEGAYYWKFTLAEAAEVSVKKSVNPALKHNDPNPGSDFCLLVEEGNEAIWGEVDGERVGWLHIRETDANLTKTINYSLPAGTYYAHLGNDRTYNGTEYTLTFSMPGTAAPPSTPLTADPTASTVLVNGENVGFDAYNIGGNNYFKLRDLAYVLNGTAKQFEVDWDGDNNAITLASGQGYTAVGGEMEGKGGGEKTPVPTNSKIIKDGVEVSFTAYNIGGNNYFKLRDIGASFDFGVDWDGERNTIVIDTSKGYTPG